MATCSVVVGYQSFGGLHPSSEQNCAKMYWLIGQIGSQRRVAHQSRECSVVGTGPLRNVVVGGCAVCCQ